MWPTVQKVAKGKRNNDIKTFKPLSWQKHQNNQLTKSVDLQVIESNILDVILTRKSYQSQKVKIC